jgi:hypothetical protein
MVIHLSDVCLSVFEALAVFLTLECGKVYVAYYKYGSE